MLYYKLYWVKFESEVNYKILCVDSVNLFMWKILFDKKFFKYILIYNKFLNFCIFYDCNL